MRPCPLEIHVSNYRKDHNDLIECSAFAQCAVPRPEQKVECLINSIQCTDSTLQDAVSLVRANTNNMRQNFEAAHSSLMEVDPYHRSSRSDGRNSDVSTIEFKAGRGSSGVYLRWHPRKEFLKLTKNQKEERQNWSRSDEGKKQKPNNFKSEKTKKGRNKKRKDHNKYGSGD